MSQVPQSTLLLFESYCRRDQVDGKKIDVRVGEVPVKVEIASTPESQARGYMGRKEPQDGGGILFVYDKPAPLHFWMKGVAFPLDIIFFDSEMNYLEHQEMEPTDIKEDSKIPRYSSKSPARFALEVRNGWCKKHLKPPCKLEI
jgi:uncharacterized membrane protein (UPF0127 family)